MKIKVLVSKHPQLKGKILEARKIPLMLGEAFQCIEGEYMGCTFSLQDAIEVDDLPISKAEYTELKQENLQRLEEVKGLQRQVESLTEYSNKTAKHLRKVREDLSKAWTSNNAEREARLLLEATLERAMLDHQPVVLPMEVAKAIDYLRSIGIDNDEILRLSFTTYRMSHCAHRSALGEYAIDYPNKVASALVNSYTVELTLSIAEQLADMIQEWTNEPTFDDEDAACLKLANAIAERTKEFYSKN